MAGNYNDGNDYSIEEQVKFAHYMVTQLEAAKIPFAVNSDTKFYNRETNTWVKKMLPLGIVYSLLTKQHKICCLKKRNARYHLQSRYQKTICRLPGKN